jgi:hypothetical protein
MLLWSRTYCQYEPSGGRNQLKNESPIDGIIAPRKPRTVQFPCDFGALPFESTGAYERNPRKNEQAVNRMSPRSSKFGFEVPILARSGGEIVDGHLRIKAAKRLGIQEVPVILCHEWTPEKVNKEKRNP